MRTIISQISTLLATKYRLSQRASITLALLFFLLGIAVAIAMMIAAPHDIDHGMGAALMGVVPMVIGVVIFFSGIFDNI